MHAARPLVLRHPHSEVVHGGLRSTPRIVFLSSNVGVSIRFRVWEHRRINQMVSNSIPSRPTLISVTRQSPSQPCMSSDTAAWLDPTGDKRIGNAPFDLTSYVLGAASLERRIKKGCHAFPSLRDNPTRIVSQTRRCARPREA